jgi:Tfp pilus assembly protein PilN
MSKGPSDDDGEMSTMLRNLAATAFLGLFSWHLITLHNIAKSVEVLIEKVSAGNTRIERLEQEVFFKDNGASKEQVR